MRTLHFFGTCVFQNTGGENLLTEIAFVQFAMQDYLVDTLQLAQGELFGQQAESNGCVVELATQPVKGILKNLGMIEGQWWQIIERKPAHIGSIARRLHLQTF